MGSSTRVPFLCQTVAQTQEFFTSFLEEWRIAMGSLSDFYLVGHSFGGYVSGLYALAYPQHVRKVLFISPIGFTKRPVNWSFERVKMRKVKDHKGRMIKPHPMINPSPAQQAVASLVWQHSICP